MKRTVLILLVILAAGPPFLSMHANAYPQTTDEHGWIGTETVETRYGSFALRTATQPPKLLTSSMNFARSIVRSNRIWTA